MSTVILKITFCSHYIAQKKKRKHLRSKYLLFFLCNTDKIIKCEARQARSDWILEVENRQARSDWILEVENRQARSDWILEVENRQARSDWILEVKSKRKHLRNKYFLNICIKYFISLQTYTGSYPCASLHTKHHPPGHTTHLRWFRPRDTY